MRRVKLLLIMSLMILTGQTALAQSDIEITDSTSTEWNGGIDIDIPVATKRYSINATSANEIMGTVTMEGGGEEVARGTQITLEAHNVEGYEFVNWTVDGNVVSTDNPYYFKATENVSLIANFKANIYTLTYYIDGWQVHSIEIECGATIEPFEPMLGEDQRFDGWQETIPETMPAHDVDIHGTTTPLHHIEAVTNEDMGTVTMEGGGEKVVNGATVTTTATPMEGYEFAGWATDGRIVSTDNPYTFTATESITLEGCFRPLTYKLTYYIDDEVVHSLDVEYKTWIEPYEPTIEEGRIFDGWQETVPETMPAHDVDIHGTTTAIYNFTAESADDSKGTIIVYTNGINTYTIIAIPAEGYELANWTINGNVVSTENPISFTATEDATLIANFKASTYKLTYYIDGEIVRSLDVEYGAPIESYEPTVNEGRVFDGWWEPAPETMPAHDVDIYGMTLTAVYKLTYYIDGEIVYSVDVEYEAPIEPYEPTVNEGRVFDGWQETIPWTMPAHDVDIHGTTSAAVYKLTYYIDGEIVYSVDMEYEAPIEPYEPTVNEGRVFDGWQETVPETMPAHDVDIYGTTSAAVYKLTYYIDGEIVYSVDMEYEAPIEPYEPTVNEGRVFNGWQETVPWTMPAHDVDIYGTTSAAVYKLTYYIDGEIVYSVDMEYEAPIEPYEPTVNEGRVFNGWQETIPWTMPAHDVDIHGTTSAIIPTTYTITATSADESMGTVITDGTGEQVEDGTQVTVMAIPAEGYEFVNWTIDGTAISYINPYTFTATKDIDIVANFKAATYRLTYYVDDEIVYSVDMEYEASIEPYEPTVTEGRVFDGWQETVPETMPAHDVDIHGTTSTISSVNAINTSIGDSVNVYSPNGTLLMKDADAEKIKMLPRGIYIINRNTYIKKD